MVKKTNLRRVDLRATSTVPCIIAKGVTFRVRNKATLAILMVLNNSANNVTIYDKTWDGREGENNKRITMVAVHSFADPRNRLKVEDPESLIHTVQLLIYEGKHLLSSFDCVKIGVVEVLTKSELMSLSNKKLQEQIVACINKSQK